MTADTDSAPDPAPVVRLDERARDLVELFSWGVFDPLEGYLSAADRRAVRAHGRRADGTPWLWDWTLEVPAPPPSGARTVTLQEPEGQPLGRVEVEECWEEDGRWHLSGPVLLERGPVTGPFRSLRRPPGPRAGSGGRVALLVDGPLAPEELLGALAEAERRPGGSGALLLLPTLGGGRTGYDTRSAAAVRSCRAARTHLGERVEIVGLPLSGACLREPAELWLAARAARRFGADTLLVRADADAAEIAGDAATARVLPAPRQPRPDEGLRRSLAAVRDAASPPEHRKGLVVLFTGLPSAGKSTVARGLRDALLDRTERSVTLLDGDVVRAVLSPDLSFSRDDRLRNLTRLATVSAECARHGGTVLCAPVAPHEQGRREFRRIVSGTANLLLVHVATPVAECSRRDAKGLYAAAAAGRLTGLTGVDDVYEPPPAPDLVVGGGEGPEGSVRLVVAELVRRGWIRPGAWEEVG